MCLIDNIDSQRRLIAEILASLLKDQVIELVSIIEEKIKK